MAATNLVLSLVERGWRSARECSLDLRAADLEYVHVVKGRLSRAVRAMVAPEPGTRLLGVPKALFWPMIALGVGAGALSGRLRAVLVDNLRSFRRLQGISRALGVPVAMIQESAAGYELWRGTERISRAAWAEAIHAHRAHL